LNLTADTWHAPTLFAHYRRVDQENAAPLLSELLQALPDMDCLKLFRVGRKGAKQAEEAIVDASLKQELRDQPCHTGTLATRHGDQHIEAKAKPTALLAKKVAVWRKAA
jgi:hypothetical protein